VTSLKPIPAGKEILNYYGPLCNGELLRRYGYVTPIHARYDVVELPWNLVLSVLRENLRLDEKTWGQAVSKVTTNI
jgi:SET domain-containing protein 6